VKFFSGSISNLQGEEDGEHQEPGAEAAVQPGEAPRGTHPGPNGGSKTSVAHHHSDVDREQGEKQDKQIIGTEITAKCVKNKVARPFRKARWSVLFNQNGPGARVYIEETMVDYLVRVGAIEKDGNRIIWEGKKIYQTQLVDAIRASKDGMQRMYDMLPSEVIAEPLPETAEDGPTEE
jgi:hypothetical protein